MCGCLAKTAYCIITLADRPFERPFRGTFCGDLFPSSLCRAGKQGTVARRLSVMDDCSCRIEMVSIASESRLMTSGLGQGRSLAASIQRSIKAYRGAVLLCTVIR